MGRGWKANWVRYYKDIVGGKTVNLKINQDIKPQLKAIGGIDESKVF